MELILVLVFTLGIIGFVIYKINGNNDAPIGSRAEQDLLKKRELQSYSTYQPTKPAPVYRADLDRRRDDDFVTSMLVAQTTNNAGLGYMVGGNLTGAIIGDSLNSADSSSSSNCDNSSYSYDSDSGSCSSSSSDSGSSGGSDW